MDRLTSLTVFAKVAESGGFSAAARRLGMSPAMVSNHVQNLEERLGARLLNRTTRRVSLTDVGQAYYEQCSRILAAIEEADQTATALQTKPTGWLRFAATDALTSVLAPVVTDYLGRYPQMQVEALMVDRVSADVVGEGLDLVVSIAPFPDTQLIVRRLTGYRHVLCAAPAYLERHGTPRTPDELTGHNCLHHAAYPFGDDWIFDGPDGETTVSVRGNLLTNGTSLLRAAAIGGIGIVIAPRFLVGDEFANGTLVPVMEDYVPRQLRLEVLYPHRHRLSVKVRLFIDALVERLDGSRPLDCRTELPRQG
ncbi:MAG TPA: LysR family transcriptional regulator [Acidiphilium sp.]|nr:LysR family transcriptional regulator [Acidiphilium sp.]